MQITKATLTVTATIPANTAITYELTANAGINWYSVTPDVEFTFPVSGTDLRCRANLSNSDRFLTPSIDGLNVSYYPVSYTSSGTYTSAVIPPSGTITQWGVLTFTSNAPVNTTFTVDVLNEAGDTVLLSGVASGGSLSSINATTYPRIRLRANFATTDTMVTPTLSNWIVDYMYIPE